MGLYQRDPMCCQSVVCRPVTLDTTLDSLTYLVSPDQTVKLVFASVIDLLLNINKLSFLTTAVCGSFTFFLAHWFHQVGYQG